MGSAGFSPPGELNNRKKAWAFFDGLKKHGIFSRWWQLKYFLCFTPISGGMIQFDEHIVSNGWEKTTNQFWLHLFDSMRLETARQKFKQSEWAAWRAIRWCYFPLFMAEL